MKYIFIFTVELDSRGHGRDRVESVSVVWVNMRKEFSFRSVFYFLLVFALCLLFTVECRGGVEGRLVFQGT